MIVLFTDFGPNGPYIGQMTAVLLREAPEVPVVNLISDAPAFDARSSAYLLAATAAGLPPGAVILAVVDPGVGGNRAPLAVRADGRWYVGPDNGLFALVLRRAARARAWEITWRPDRLSASFHGRDLFAPVAARLARGLAPPGDERPARAIGGMPGADWPDDLARVIYVDGYGNAVTGLRAASLGPGTLIAAAGRRLERARTFCALPQGTPFWYENADGLAEIAVNRGHAARDLGLTVGSELAVTPPPEGFDS